MLEGPGSPRTGWILPEGIGCWLSDLPAEPPLRELVGLATLCRRVEHDYRELTTGLGLDHFEDRSLPGWCRHLALITPVRSIRTQLRYASKPLGR